MASVPFSVRLDEDLKASLEAEAKREDITASQLATRAIRKMLEDRAAYKRMLDEAVAEADKGVFISSEAVMAWVESWGTDNELPRPEPDVFL
ncbi:MAG: ribbon-helix-helix protein, CopG family [Rhodobacteraceae bacterium]|nr:ribbon-helix-helix protein, CopG family [Paracoccaceae bacterium]